MRNIYRRAVLPVVLLPVILVAGLSACTTAPVSPRVPAALNPPAGQSLVLEAMAEGVQIYTCDQNPDGSYAWVFKAPEAALHSRNGQAWGKHYAGPTWEAADGSSVVGQVTAKDPGPDPAAVPWLLLTAKAHAGNGVLSKIKAIQRVNTVGGLPPAAACNAANLKALARTPYSATYYFYE